MCVYVWWVCSGKSVFCLFRFFAHVVANCRSARRTMSASTQSLVLTRRLRELEICSMGPMGLRIFVPRQAFFFFLWWADTKLESRVWSLCLERSGYHEANHRGGNPLVGRKEIRLCFGSIRSQQAVCASGRNWLFIPAFEVQVAGAM